MVHYAAIVADYSPLISESLAVLCQGFAGCRVLGHCSDGEEAWTMIDRLKPDIAIVDAQLPGIPVAELLRRTRQASVATRIVVTSSRADQRVALETIRIGARAFVLKTDTARHLEEGLRSVLEGSVYVSSMEEWSAAAPGGNPLATLSAREQQVFTMLVEGARAKEIARDLSLSPKTVDTYRASLMRKLALTNTIGLVKFAIQHRITRTGD